MASRIQGITVEIGGDTTKLSKALESVNKSIKGTQSGLKDVNKLLKLDPSNTELVVQKQKMLKDAIEATKEKLATLKTAAQQANEQLANGEITQQQYDALQREIVETEQNLRSLQDQAATTNATLAKIDEAGEKLQNIGSSVENVGKKFLPVTAAVTGLGTAAVKTVADFDSEMSKVSAISGATGDDFDQLRAKAREMGAKTKFSASEAASAMEYMAMAGWKTSDMLNGIEGVMNLAAASGEDLATTSDIVTDALTAFGLSAADSGHFADILAAASSNANTNVSMMGETFKYCAPIAGALGFSAEDTAEAIGLMANSGIKASQAGTSLRTIMNNLSGEVTFAGKNIGEVTIATSNADGSMRSLNDILADCRVAFSGLSESEKAANAEALVGKNAMSGFLALMNSSQSDIDKLSSAIENCAVAGYTITDSHIGGGNWGGTGLGGLFGRILSGVISHFLPWHWVLTVIGVAGVLFSLLVWRLLPPQENFQKSPPGIKTLIAHTKAVLSEPGLALLFLIGALTLGAYQAVFNMVPYRFSAAPYLFPAWIVSGFFLVNAFGSLAASVSGNLVARYGRRRVMPLAALLTLIGLLLTIFETLWIVIPALIIFAIGFFAVHATASGWVTARAVAGVGAAGQAASAYSISYYLGGSCFGTVGGIAWYHWGWSGLVALTAALIALVVVFALLLRKIPPLEKSGY